MMKPEDVRGTVHSTVDQEQLVKFLAELQGRLDLLEARPMTDMSPISETVPGDAELAPGVVRLSTGRYMLKGKFISKELAYV